MSHKKTFDEFFVEMEKKWLMHWEKNGIISDYLTKNDDSTESYSFLDGPITANNPMGVHHAWGRTYKDLWRKFHNLLGKKQLFQNGFDCQGLWVEVEVEKDLGLKTKKDIESLVEGDEEKSIARFVQLCKDRVYKFADIQTQQSKRLGYFMDWDHSYFTMSDDNNYMIWKFIQACHTHGWLYKGKESVPWCPRCETAISQHEILTEDYHEVVHESIYFELPIVGKSNEYLLVWTTTPWTIPANIAVAVDKDLKYAQVQGETGDLYWVANDAVDRIFGSQKQIKNVVKGKELVGLHYKGPFDDLPAVKKVAKSHVDTFHSVIATDSRILPITTEEGTGLVHTAVSAGTEDFKLGKKYKLPMIPVIADDASYLEGLGFLTGNNAKKHPRIILDHLVERDTQGENWVFKIENYKHRYPRCWRCKKELVWKVADEWYIAMDIPSKSDTSDSRTLRERMIDVTKQITWMPSFGLDRELDWLNNMHDWLISKKNRYWGLALPIWESEDGKTFEVIGSREELQKRALTGWNEFEEKSPHKPYVDNVVIESKNGEKLYRIKDVGNPWLDAGIVPFSTISKDNTSPLYLENREEWLKWFPVDFITESFPGQFKNWFYALIAMSTVLEDTFPFQRVLGYATLLDENGNAMHKSTGNSIEFNEGADKIGVDVMRWMYARQNPADNLLFGYNRAKEVRRAFYLPLWNSYKYYTSYHKIDSIEPIKSFDVSQANHILDIWILTYLSQLVSQVHDSLVQYDSRKASEAIEQFVNDLSTWYIRRSRSRTGTSSSDTQDKKEFYSTLYFVLTTLTTILSPFLPFLTEEIFTSLTAKRSVHLESWPKLPSPKDLTILDDMNLVRAIVEVGHRARKEQQCKLRQPLASVSIFQPKTHQFIDKSKLRRYTDLIRDELNVKNVTFSNSTSNEISVEYDLTLTPQLKQEGELRELIRKIQSERKAIGVLVGEKINLTIPKEYKYAESEIAHQVSATKIEYGNTIQVSKT